MDTRMAQGRRWAANTMKLFGIILVVKLFFAFKSNQFKGLVEAAMVLAFGLVFAVIAFGLGWLVAVGAGIAKGKVGGDVAAPEVTNGAAVADIPTGDMPLGAASDADVPVPAADRSARDPGDADVPVPAAGGPARQPGVADFDGARQRHELNAIVNAAFAAYPFLNDDNEEFDQSALDEVMQYRDFYYSSGYSLPDALRKAIADVGPRYASQRVGRLP